MIAQKKLALNASGIAEATYAITQASIDAGRVENSAKVSREAPNGNSNDDSDSSVTNFSDWAQVVLEMK